MAFNATKFLQTQFKRREKSIPVPDMALFFEEDETPEWKVQGLTGQELGACNAAVERNKNISAVLEGIASNRPDGIKNAIAELTTMNGIPDDIAKRIALLIHGSVEPKVDENLAVQICSSYPIEFYLITNTITQLTGQGFEPGK